MSDPKITDFLRTQVSKRTNVPLDEVTDTSNLADLGLESIDAVLLCGDTEDEFGIEIDPAMIFEHETLGSFAAEVAALYAAK